MADGIGVGLGVKLGVGLGDGVGTGVAVEPEALTAPPPQPATLKTREKNSTQHTSFGPMGNGLLHTAPLDATELLDVVLVVVFPADVFPQKQNRPRPTAGLVSWLLDEGSIGKILPWKAPQQMRPACH